MPLRIDPSIDTDPIHIHSDFCSLHNQWVSPHTTPANVSSDMWIHRQREQEALRLAGHDGVATRDTFTAIGLQLTREIWRDDTAIALRQRLANTGAETIHLHALTPLSCAEQGLQLGETPAAQWRVLAHQRLKNGIPSAFSPGLLDEDFQHVSRGMTETGSMEDGSGHLEQISMDPCALLQAQNRILLVGFLSQRGHCAHIAMHVATQDADTTLRQLSAESEFDGVELPPGGERTSQWVFLNEGDSAQTLLDDFAERVGTYHGVHAPTEKPPSVFCSWQFYGESFCEEDFHADLAYLKKDRVPFDVFLIDDCWTTRGDYHVNELWPNGMSDAAQRIRELGYRPGIWNCPFIAKTSSEMAAQHPEWLLRRKDGTPHLFYVNGPNYVLDPTYPGVCDFWEDIFRRMTHDWGFSYHKLDFMRAVFLDPEIRFHNPTATRLEAYQMGLEAIRRGAGPDAYISVCGGHYGGSLGLADSQRSGSDVASSWHDPPALPKFKQNLLRTWMSRLWHVDPDAMMVRRRTEVYRETLHGFLSLGKFSDTEAQTIAINQYIGGGMVCLCEKFSELDADRKALYKHVIPSINSPGQPLAPFAKTCPPLILTAVQPACEDLAPWITICAVNWTDEEQALSIELTPSVCDTLSGDAYLVSEFFAQQVLGVFAQGATIDLGPCAPHSSRVVRIAAWDGQRPALAGTDLHFSGGGVEIAEWQAESDAVKGRVETPWSYPVQVSVAFPCATGYALKTATTTAAERSFSLRGEKRSE